MLVADKHVTVVAHEVHTMGGMERAQAEMILGLLDRGWQVTLVTRTCRLPPHRNLRVVAVRTPARPFALGLPLFALFAGLLLRRHRRGTVVALGAIVPNRVDVITVQFCHAGFRAQRVPRAARSTRARRLNDAVGSALAVGLERWCYRLGRTRRLLPVSPVLAEQLRTHHGSAVGITVLPNGVDPDRFTRDEAAGRVLREQLGIDDEALVAVFVGGDWERKGLRIAAEACAHAGWTLLVVGAGDEERYTDLAHRLGADVRFTGRLANPLPALSAADAFVLPSIYEGFALVTIEAAACGLPLLVTAATGAAPLVEGGGGELLARDAEAFGTALERFASHERRRVAGTAARSAAEALSWTMLVRRYERALEEVAPADRAAVT